MDRAVLVDAERLFGCGRGKRQADDRQRQFPSLMPPMLISRAPPAQAIPIVSTAALYALRAHRICR
jgi:hypothetical protein